MNLQIKPRGWEGLRLTVHFLGLMTYDVRNMRQERRYDSIVQWRSTGKCVHFGWDFILLTKDWSRHLCQALPSFGSVLCFPMQGEEKRPG
jgi:hypothetical protein